MRLRPGPRLRFVLPLFLLSASIVVINFGCSAAQKDAFTSAMTGQSPTSLPSGVAWTSPTTNTPTPPTPGSVEGITQQAASVGAVIAAGTAGTPIGTVAGVVAAIASGLLIVERMATMFVAQLPNSKSSPSALVLAGGATGPTPTTPPPTPAPTPAPTQTTLAPAAPAEQPKLAA